MSTPPLRLEDRLAKRGGAVELLRLPAAAFGLAAGLRSRLYDRGWLPHEKLGVPVICVGNLSVGGTGKTPMVVWLARELLKRGRRPGLLSRGYGKGHEEKNDEAFEMERALPGVPHIQNPDRVAGGHALLEQGVDIVVMDDGFQHRRLVRDLDLVMVDATRPWGLPYPDDEGEAVCALIPRGFLREAPAALRRANAIVLTRTDQSTDERVQMLRRELESRAPGVPIVDTVHSATGLRAIRGPALELEQLRGREVELFSGIGNPAGFEASTRALGAKVVEHRRFPDHHSYVSGDLIGLGEGRTVLTTAKDISKCEALAPMDELYVLEVELTIQRGEPVLEALLDSLAEGFAERQRNSIHAGLHG